MTKTLLKTITTKSGKTIVAGTRVKLAFDVKNESGNLYPSIFSMTAPDGTRIISRDLTKVGIKTPSLTKMENYSSAGIAGTPFGGRTEPDGWANGAPSWLLFAGLV